MQVYNRFPVTFTHGQGVYLYDDQGRRYFDAGAGIAVNAFGHCHPEMVQAVTDQAQKLWHISNLYTSDVQTDFAKLLCDNSFADVVFFTNSGAEAVECALKTARRHFHHMGQPKRKRVITFSGAFHGRTQLCISSTGTKTEEGFGTVSPDFDIVPFGDHDALRAAITDETAAIMVEPIIGEGGIKVIPEPCLRGLRDLCDEHGILLIFDEIQCGMGRSGKLFAFEYADVQPDICTSAKGIAAGFPLGACLATHKAAAGMVYGTHGSTYGGNPLACAAGHKAVSMLLADGFMKNVQETGAYLLSGLKALATQYPHIFKTARGKGFMQALVLTEDYAPRDIAEKLLQSGVIVIPASDNAVRFLPPLILTKGDCDILLDLLKSFFAQLEKE